VGCGTGIWTRAFAAEHPSSRVIGVDLNPPHERFVEDTNVSGKTNYTFIKADFFENWSNFANAEHDADVVIPPQYDFVYMRMLMAAVSDWPALLTKGYEALVPGGRLEVFEGLMEMNAEDGSTAETSAAIRWFEMAQRYMTTHNIKWNSVLDLPTQLREAGFGEIEKHPIKMRLYRDGDEEVWVGQDYARDMAGLVDGMGKRLRGDKSSTLSEEEWDVLEREAKRELMEEGEKRGFHTML
jgi:ubiquinone/menaquinone biosynthesis C-methylase UbiE